MGLPPDIITRPRTFGGATGLETGTSLSISVTVKAVLIGGLDDDLIWADTGWMWPSTGVTVAGEPGVEVTVNLPVTDLPGWRSRKLGGLIDVSAPDSYSHRYVATITISDGGRPIRQWTSEPFIQPTGDGTPIDHDAAITVTSVQGGVVSIPDTWGPIVADAQAAAEQAAAASVGDVQPPWMLGSHVGLLYDGTDETATVQSIINTLADAGGGVLELDGLARCDGQLTIPTTLVGTQLRQPPIRITGGVQYMPGSVFAEASPYPAAGGLDLRYTGRTDTGCTTEVGSEIVLNPAAQESDRGLIATGPGIPDQAWIMSVDPGVSWHLYRPARATATAVSMTSFGGRIQSFGYGTLTLDHIQLVTGTPSQAPIVASTATTIVAHDNLLVGSVGKERDACDEDAFVLGGPGQGTRLTAPLNAGTAYTTLTVAPLPVGVTTGRRMLIGAGTATEQEVTLAASALTGATTLNVTSFTPSASHAAGRTVYIGYCQSQINPTSWTVPSCPFQGYGTEITRNHFHRLRRISIGGFASSLSIRRNSWMHTCGSNLAAVPSTLTAGLTANITYTALPVTALSRAVVAGDIIQTGVGDMSQEWVATSGVAAGATSIPVMSAVARYTLASGTVAFNTQYIGAGIESYAIASEINAPLVTENRIGVISYSYAVRFSGATMHAYIAANDCQDAQAATMLLAGYRFDRRWLWGARFNLLIPGLVGDATVPVIDDWSYDGRLTQTVINHDQSSPARFSQGISVAGELSQIVQTGPTSTATFTPKIKTPDGGSWRWLHDYQDSTLRHVDSSVMRVRDNPAGVNATVLMVATGYASFSASAGDVRLTAGTGKKAFIGDASTPANTYVLGGRLYSPSVQVTPVASASRPDAATVGAGTMVYDSTLAHPIWSDGTVWRDAMGTAV